MLKNRSDYLRLILAIVLCLAFVASARADDAGQIRDLMKATWEKYNQPLKVDPVVTEGVHGIAAWVQGERGGRALLERRAGKWKVIACAGDALKSANELTQAGMPPRVAERLAQALARAEAKLPEQTRRKFSLFDGIVGMDASPAGAHK